jgi:dienelactone hydrolase
MTEPSRGLCLPAATITIEPEQPNLDTELRTSVTGLPANAEVTLRATMVDQYRREWRSTATFRTGNDGRVDLHRDAPVAGSYTGVDPMGLVWSMDLTSPATGPVPPGEPAVFTLVAAVDGTDAASARVERATIPPGLTRTEVSEGGLVGVLFHPADGARYPGVLVLGGAEGGLHEDDAALLAAHGYAALALAYYGPPGLPPTLQDVPLEYFGTALDYLRANEHVGGGRFGVVGGSKGGEAALLIGARYPDVGVVVSIVGSGLATQGISQSVTEGSFLSILGTPVAGWTWEGREVPYLPNVITPELEKLVAAGEPISLGMAFGPALALADLLPAATIPVERIRGSVLLVSSTDDRGYGAAYHQVAADRLHAHEHPYRWEHVVYEDAGHAIAAPPYAPTTVSRAPGPGVTFVNGGTPAADARARADVRRLTLEYLSQMS